jgi:hypothetical protein
MKPLVPKTPSLPQLKLWGNPVHQTDVELAFLVAARVHVFALRLQGIMLAEHAEEAALAAGAHVAVLIGADVDTQQLEFLPFFPLDRGGRGHRHRRRLIHLRFQHRLVVLQVGNVFLQLRVLIRQVLQ